MKKLKSKTKVISMAIFLILSMTASIMLVSVPTASAHSPPWNVPTYAYINVTPNPVGVNQTVYVIMWLDKIIDSASPTNDIRFQNYNLTITKPDHTTETTIFPIVEDTTSAHDYPYTPDQVGNYTFTFTFPGQKYTYTDLIEGFFGGPPAQSAYLNDTYLPSTASVTLDVQQTPLPAAVGSSPLPTQYWNRPIYGENNIWYTISSNWLGFYAPGYNVESFSFTPSAMEQLDPVDNVGSLTSHIMWNQPLQSGGVVGGDELPTQGDTYFEGSAYYYRYINPIIMDGMIYFNPPVGQTGSESGPTECVNLQTGQLIWSNPNMPMPSFGYIYDAQDMNQHGVWPPILIVEGGMNSIPAGTWVAYDGDTGDWLFNVTNVPTGSYAMGPSGEYLSYVVANDGTPTAPQYYLGQWNSSNLGSWAGAMASGAITGVVDGSASSIYDWNVSIPYADTMTSSYGMGFGQAFTVLDAYAGNLLLCFNGSIPDGGSPSAPGPASETPYTYFAINLNATRGHIGSLLWMHTYNPPAGNISVLEAGADPLSGVFVEEYKETMQWVGYNMYTGEKMWGPVGNQGSFDYYGNQEGSGELYNTGFMAYGNLYYSGFGGIVYCYNATTGNLKWTYGNGGEGNSTFTGFQTAYGHYPTNIAAIGSGVLYLATTEHTITTPIYKGALTRAINATDGSEIWTLSSYTGSLGGPDDAIADGYTTFFNGYDNQLYVVGRGPSATTVTAPNAGLSFGQSLVISGSVTDISAGTKQTEQAADFPNGVPCASDASMSAWMSYVYQQQPFPTNFTGVPVQISVLDSNGNYRSVGTATTDASGAYSLTWTPNISGNYTVVASFAGTNGYWPSSAETYFNVMNAPTSTSAPTATPTSVADMYFVPAIAGLFVLIIIVLAVVVLLMLRKRP